MKIEELKRLLHTPVTIEAWMLLALIAFLFIVLLGIGSDIAKLKSQIYSLELKR